MHQAIPSGMAYLLEIHMNKPGCEWQLRLIRGIYNEC